MICASLILTMLSGLSEQLTYEGHMLSALRALQWMAAGAFIVATGIYINEDKAGLAVYYAALAAINGFLASRGSK